MNFEEHMTSDPVKDNQDIVEVSGGLEDGPPIIDGLQKDDMVQVRGEVEPAVVEGFLLDATGKRLMVQVRNMRTRGVRDVAATDILQKIEGADTKDSELGIAGNIIAQAANDEIESWKDKK